MTTKMPQPKAPHVAPRTSKTLWNHRVDIVIVVLLGLSSVLATWAGYQAGQWSGLKAESGVIVEDLQQAADRATILGYQDRQVDIAIFMAWLEAYKHDDAVLAAFYEARFVPHFRPAFDAWMATDPFTAPDAPLDPFRMGEYVVPSLRAADTFNAHAAEVSAAGQEFKRQADAYIFLTVLTAVVLFIGGVTTKIEMRQAQIALLAMASLLLTFCIVRGLTLPKAGTVFPPTAEIVTLDAAIAAGTPTP
ncbi:MAG: hypothetical protein QM692_15150 [Thermomicrobiales bacterium]